MTSTAQPPAKLAMAALLSTGDAMGSGRKSPKNIASGFTYLGVLFAISILSIGLTLASEIWVKTVERQKMAELTWIGNQYVQAIESYYQSKTGSINYYPPNLASLILDDRFLGIKRHIRTLYPNPFTGHVDWTIISANEGGVAGVQVSVNGETFAFQYTSPPNENKSKITN